MSQFFPLPKNLMPLFTACFHCQPEHEAHHSNKMKQLLLDHRLQNRVDDILIDWGGGQAPLIGAAAQDGNMYMVRMLRENFKANVNTKATNGQTALMLAARCGNQSMVKYLVDDLGADVSAKDARSRTALDHAYGGDYPDPSGATQQFLRQKMGIKTWGETFQDGVSTMLSFGRQQQVMIQDTRALQENELFLLNIEDCLNVKRQYIEAICKSASPENLHILNICIQSSLTIVNSGSQSLAKDSVGIQAAQTRVLESSHEVKQVISDSGSPHQNLANDIEEEITNYLLRGFAGEDVPEIQCVVSHPDERIVSSAMSRVLAAGHRTDDEVEYIKNNPSAVRKHQLALANQTPTCQSTSRPVNDEMFYQHLLPGTETTFSVDPTEARARAIAEFRRSKAHEGAIEDQVVSISCDEFGNPEL